MAHQLCEPTGEPVRGDLKMLGYSTELNRQLVAGEAVDDAFVQKMNIPERQRSD